MIRTLRITSILAVALAAVLVVFSVIFGVRGDNGIERLLGEPSVIEKFNESAGNKAAKRTNQVSPLVQQAGAFALYLNPPEPKAPRVTRSSPGVRQLPSVTPKFTVLATSYYKDHPELSIAMVDEPGKGRNWVRQSSKVGHLQIVEIKDGVVVVKDSSGTFELYVEQKPQISLLEGTPVIGSKGTGVSSKVTGRTDSKTSTVAPSRSSRYSGRAIPRTSKIPMTSLPDKTEKKDSVMEELTAELAQLQSKIKSGEYTEPEKAAMYNRLITKFQASKSENLSDEEKKRLSILGEELKKKMEESEDSSQK